MASIQFDPPSPRAAIEFVEDDGDWLSNELSHFVPRVGDRVWVRYRTFEVKSVEWDFTVSLDSADRAADITITLTPISEES